jgi:hypothetical protein
MPRRSLGALGAACTPTPPSGRADDRPYIGTNHENLKKRVK